jgi:hypothetical protein
MNRAGFVSAMSQARQPLKLRIAVLTCPQIIPHNWWRQEHA